MTRCGSAFCWLETFVKSICQASWIVTVLDIGCLNIGLIYKWAKFFFIFPHSRQPPGVILCIFFGNFALAEYFVSSNSSFMASLNQKILLIGCSQHRTRVKKICQFLKRNEFKAHSFPRFYYGWVQVVNDFTSTLILRQPLENSTARVGTGVSARYETVVLLVSLSIAS